MMALTVPSAKKARWQTTDLVRMLLSAGARQVVSNWVKNEDYLDDQHQPRILLNLPHDPHSFIKLVKSANPNLVPAVVLSELLRKGIAESLECGHVLLKRSAYVPLGEYDSRDGEFEPFQSFGNARRRYNDT
ncbi:hypothetical protein [Marinobacter sp. VGCF2001]|uniref:hypothetical protein n=1 Tax=Marinobacter sp. VGCF2001 TaxID=3417189 RepID=UPI003CEF689C